MNKLKLLLTATFFFLFTTGAIEIINASHATNSKLVASMHHGNYRTPAVIK